MEADLLAAIYAAPADDAPRLVYADWLQERGDPRGEFIALQLRGKDVDRQAALIAEHGPAWIGDLPARIVAWERGFISACRPHPGADPRDPRWATVSHIHGAELLDDAAPLPWLRALDLHDGDFLRLAQLTRPIAAETIVWHMDDHGWRVHMTFARLAILPALRRFEILDERRSLPRMDRYWRSPDELAWLVASPLLGNLAELALRVDLSNLAPWLERFTPTGAQRLELADPAADPWRVRFARDSAGGLGELEVHLPAAPPDPAAFKRFGDAMVAGLLSLSRHQLSAARIVGATEATVDTVARLERRLQTQTRVRRIEIA